MKKARKKKRRSLFNRPLRILLATNGLVLVAGAMFGPIYAVFVEEVGGDLLDASLTAGIFALAAGITTLLSGYYSDKVKEKELVVVWGYIIMGVGFLLYIFVDSVLFLFAVQALIGFAEAFYSPSFDAAYSTHLTKGMAGRQWAGWESLNYFTIAGGSAVGGFVALYYGFDIVFVIMAALCFCSALYIYLLPRKVI